MRFLAYLSRRVFARFASGLPAALGAAALSASAAVSAPDGPFRADTLITDVIADRAFAGFGRLIFPAGMRSPEGLRLQDAALMLPWYSAVRPERTVAIVNYLHREAAAGRQIFFEIYSDAEQRSDPAKQDTGLFFFRGRPGAPAAVLCAGGGFAYVGAMHDSFPLGMELADLGFNAFALIYRPDPRKACEDLAHAVAFINAHARELETDVGGYSLWGGSAGARMAAWVGSLGTAHFGGPDLPHPAAVIMQYTGLDEVYGSEPPTYSCVGTADSIASYRVMQRRTGALRSQGTDAVIEVFEGLPHGFGLGEGTVAEGWHRRAAAFWERHRTTGAR